MKKKYQILHIPTLKLCSYFEPLGDIAKICYSRDEAHGLIQRRATIREHEDWIELTARLGPPDSLEEHFLIIECEAEEYTKQMMW